MPCTAAGPVSPVAIACNRFVIACNQNLQGPVPHAQCKSSMHARSSRSVAASMSPPKCISGAGCCKPAARETTECAGHRLIGQSGLPSRTAASSCHMLAHVAQLACSNGGAVCRPSLASDIPQRKLLLQDGSKGCLAAWQDEGFGG